MTVVSEVDSPAINSITFSNILRYRINSFTINVNGAGYLYWILRTAAQAKPDANEVMDLSAEKKKRRLIAYSVGATNDEGLTEWETAML